MKIKINELKLKKKKIFVCEVNKNPDIIRNSIIKFLCRKKSKKSNVVIN